MALLIVVPVSTSSSLDLEVKIRIRRNVRADLPLAIAQMSRHEEPALTADFHSHQADIPALDHAPGAYHALEWLATRVSCRTPCRRSACRGIAS